MISSLFLKIDYAADPVDVYFPHWNQRALM
jgi:hypothetical protein